MSDVVDKNLGNRPTGEPMASREAPLAIGHGPFTDGLCEVDGHCHSMHRGLLLVVLMGVS